MKKLSEKQFRQAYSDDRLTDYDRMKRRLNAFRDLNKEIRYELDRLERLEEKATSPSSPVLSGMPRSPGFTNTAIPDKVSKIVELRNEIEELVSFRDSEEVAINTMIGFLVKPEERAVIRIRYLDNEDWEDVLFVLFGAEKDLNDKYEEYKQKMFRWHRSAIQNMVVSNDRTQ